MPALLKVTGDAGGFYHKTRDSSEQRCHETVLMDFLLGFQKARVQVLVKPAIQ